MEDSKNTLTKFNLKKLSIKQKIPLVLVLFFAFVFSLDFFIFEYLFYKFPNELEWDTSPWYNFQHKVKNTKPFSFHEKGVLVVGSSVALYSILPSEVEKVLNHENIEKPYRIEFFSHVAMSPTDLWYYLENALEKKPLLVVYLLNPADFQFDYFDLTQDGKLEKYDENRRIHHYVTRYPVKHIYPARFVWDYFTQLNKDEIFSLLSKQLFFVNRTRLFFFDPLNTYYERHFRGGRSYHNYTGTTPNEGIYIKGWTKESFTINCETPTLHEFVYSEIPNNTLRVETEGISKVFSLNKGWNLISMELPNTKPFTLLRFHTEKLVSSKVVDPKSYAKEKFYGVRLSQNFCKSSIEENLSYIRPKALEDTELFEMSLDEYEEDYFNRLYKDEEQRLELIRQRHIRKVKKALSNTEFQTWSEWDSFTKIQKRLTKKGIPFVIINNPESQKERELYENSKWYEGYISKLKSYEDEVNTFFYDLSRYVTEPRFFLDSHHLTYLGAEYMTKIYAEIIQRHVGKHE